MSFLIKTENVSQPTMSQQKLSELTVSFYWKCLATENVFSLYTWHCHFWLCLATEVVSCLTFVRNGKCRLDFNVQNRFSKISKSLLQGQPSGFDTKYRPRRPIKTIFRFLVIMMVSVYAWDWGIWVSSTSFLKSNIGWPQQPPTEELLKFNMSFHD